MTTLTNAQIAALARAAGLPESALPMAVAVAICESGGNPDAVGDKDNPAPGCCSVGLWQINSCPKRDVKDGTVRFGSEPMRLKDPATNARSMAVISNNGTTWGPWSTKGKAAAMARTIDIGAAIAAPSTPSTGPSEASASTQTDEGSVDLTAGSTWVRVAEMFGGLVLILVGVALVLSDTVLDSTGGLVSAVSGATAQ